MQLKHLANQLIPASDGKKVLKKQGDTKNIVAEVIACFKDSREQLTKFAPHFKAATLQQTLFNVWDFWKTNINYKVDPQGVQWVQEPAALWTRKEGDCKSLSLAVMCTLYALNIKAAFRFANYNAALQYPTHVYVVVLNNGKEIPVDCVWTEYGTEKKYSNKWDYNMTDIFRLSGIDEVAGKRRKQRRINKRGVLSVDVHDERVTPDVMDIALDKQRLEMEQIIKTNVEGIGFIGSDHDNAYEIAIAAHHNALAAILGWAPVSITGYDTAVHPQERYCVGEEIGFLGLGKKAKAKKLEKAKTQNAAGKAVSKKQAKKLAKAGITATKVKDGLLKRIGKGIKKVLTTPARLAIKATLPKNAPFFLYTYITDPKVLAKLPQAVAVKRQKALDYKKKIVDGLQMNESNFDKTVRNGIMNTFAKSPEDVLAQWMKDANFSVGFVAAALSLAGKGVKALLGKLGENIAADVETYTPTPEDWGTIASDTLKDMADQIKYQESNSPAVNKSLYTADTYDYGGYAPASNKSTDSSSESATDESAAAAAANTADDTPPTPPAPEKNYNTAIFIGLAALGLLAASNGGGRKKSK